MEGGGVVRVFTFEVVTPRCVRSFANYDEARDYGNTLLAAPYAIWRCVHNDDGEHTRVSRMLVCAFKARPVTVVVRSSVEPAIVYRTATFDAELPARVFAEKYAYRCPGAVEVVFH